MSNLLQPCFPRDGQEDPVSCRIIERPLYNVITSRRFQPVSHKASCCTLLRSDEVEDLHTCGTFCCWRHHSSLRHLGQWSSAQPHVVWTPLGFRTPRCHNSFAVLLLQAVRRMYGDAGLFLFSRVLPDQIGATQRRFRVQQNRDKPEISVPPLRSHRYHAAESLLCLHKCILEKFRTYQTRGVSFS